MFKGTLNHAQFLARHFSRDQLQYAIIAVLFELKVPMSLPAFDYIMKAIIISFDDPISPAVKGLYATVGEMYNPIIGSNAIEQAIRAAVKKAWKERDAQVWSYYFAPDGNGNYKKPTNMEFIRSVMRFLTLWQGCCKEELRNEN